MTWVNNCWLSKLKLTSPWSSPLQKWNEKQFLRVQPVCGITGLFSFFFISSLSLYKLSNSAGRFTVTDSQTLKKSPSVFLCVSQGSFGGLCMLYGRVSFNTTSNLIGVQSSSAPSLCYFVSAISIIVSVVCFSLSLYWLYSLCIEREMSRWPTVVCVCVCVFPRAHFLPPLCCLMFCNVLQFPATTWL